MSSLYTLTAEAQMIAEAADQDMATDEFDAMLVIKEENRVELEAKLLSYARLVLNTKSEVDAIQAEIERLEKRGITRENLIKRLKAAMDYAMAAADIQKVADPVTSVIRKKNPVGVEITDEKTVPDQFRKVTLQFAPGAVDPETMWDLREKYRDDKMTVKEDFAKSEITKHWKETGEEPPGTKIRNTTYCIQIK